MPDKLIVYLIDKDNCKVIGTYPDHEAAEDAANEQFDFATIDEINDLKGLKNKDLTGIYNAYHKDKPIKKFDTLERGIQRVWDMLTHMDPNDFAGLQRGKKMVTHVTEKTVSKKKTVKKKTAKKKASKPKVETGRRVIKKGGELGKVDDSIRRYEDGKRVTVSSEFRRLINEGCDKETTLTAIREGFPKKEIPDSYYSWYKGQVKRLKEKQND